MSAQTKRRVLPPDGWVAGCFYYFRSELSAMDTSVPAESGATLTMEITARPWLFCCCFRCFGKRMSVLKLALRPVLRYARTIS